MLIYTAHTHINIYVCIIMMATLLEPGPGGIRGTPQQGGESGFWRVWVLARLGFGTSGFWRVWVYLGAPRWGSPI